MKTETKMILISVLGVFFAFYLGFKTKQNEAVLQEQVADVAGDYVKGQARVTKKWANQVINEWKKIWK